MAAIEALNWLANSKQYYKLVKRAWKLPSSLQRKRHLTHSCRKIHYESSGLSSTTRNSLSNKLMKKETLQKYPNVREILEERSKVFSPNIGKAVGRQVTIMTDETVTPVVQKPRRVPYNLAAKTEEKIAYLLNQDIIEKVPDDETRTWISPTFIVPKPSSDQIRLCVDMRMANKAILHPYTQLPTMEDVTNKFQGAKKFSKLDLREAYHQFELTTESHKIRPSMDQTDCIVIKD
ncbi:Hypothetical predicted protein [Paramuricea clavata]|uniref:Uncharacterized protein n=1 Tax=Paramuricea clavata TaxID=317549 RepID=A0A7D9D8W8_PARCT|nr:Hypothetical predicted protein [Paramuricea clavata]